MRRSVCCSLAVILVALAAVLPAGAAPLANVRVETTGIEWQSSHAGIGLVLTVSGPGGFYLRQEFAAGASPSFSVFDPDGGLRSAGSYTYELRPVPVVDPAVRDEVQGAREAGLDGGSLLKAGQVPAEVQSGSFSIHEGEIVAGGEPEPGAGRPAGGNRLAQKDQVIPDDLIVQGSICAGLDCVVNEDFGFDTVRLKENNTRIGFNDTSVGTFPTNNWQIRANSNVSGATSFLGFVDQGASGLGETGTIVFAVEAGAAANSLYVDTATRVGIGTSVPVLNLHITSTNTPALRLEQTSAGGFTAQTWDVAGNEANFFVRSVTTGSQLPFRIRPGAPSSSIDISADGDVGIGTGSPSASLHVTRSDGTTQLLVEETSGTEAVRNNVQITNNGRSQVRLTDTSADGGNSWFFGTREGGFQINEENDAGQNDFILSSSGSITIPGTITTSGSCSVGCDRVFDPDFEVAPIEKHAELMWQNRHLPAVGPTPEDGPFNLTEKTGGMLHELEVAHIYIEQLHDTVQSLEAKLGEKDQEVRVLADELAALKASVEEMRAER